MLNPADPNADASLSPKVGECPHCQTMFAIPVEAEVQETSFLCPACEAELSATSMRPRTLPVAKFPPNLPAPVTQAPVTQAPVTKAPEKPVEQPTPGLTGSSLLGGVIPQAASLGKPTPSSENVTGDAVPQAKKSLSETLGWTPGDFTPTAFPRESADLSKTEPTVAGPVEAEPIEAESVEKVPYKPLPGNATLPDTKAPTLSDFRFDFGDDLADRPTPLEEVSSTVGEELAKAKTLDYSAEDFVSRLASTASDTVSGTVESVVDEVTSVEEWSTSQDVVATSLQKKSWAGPLSAVAGLLVVGLPAGYFALTGFDSNALLNADLAGENRTSRAEMAKEEMPPAPFAMRDRGVVTAAAAIPEKKVKEAMPASFEAAPDPPTKRVSEANGRYANNPRATGSRPVSDRYVKDRYAKPQNEPNPFAAADAMEIEAPSVALKSTVALESATERKRGRLTGAPDYGFEALVQAVAEANPSASAFAEGSLANEEEVPAMGQHYARLCYLAQVLTLMDPAGSHPDRMTQEFEAVDLFKRLFRNAGAREDSRQIAGPWMTWSGRPHGGVFFAGIPDETRRAGELFEYRFPVADSEVFVVTEEPLDAKRFLNSQSNEVGVIGIVVEDPEKRIRGYEGTAERVIWARKTAPLPPTGN